MTEIEERIRSAIIEVTGIDVLENVKCQKRELAEARMIYFFLAKKNQPNKSFRLISETLEKDHSTVIHAIKKTKIYLEVDEDFKKRFCKVESIVRGRNVDVAIHLKAILGGG